VRSIGARFIHRGLDAGRLNRSCGPGVWGFRPRHSLCEAERLGVHHSGLVRDSTHLVATPRTYAAGAPNTVCPNTEPLWMYWRNQSEGYKVWDFRDSTDGRRLAEVGCEEEPRHGRVLMRDKPASTVSSPNR
jgi:hypothetical protein